jgi:TrmH family RNA methyltransferase
VPLVRVTTRNARFQQWRALLDNRTKRQRSGEFLVQGVRAITLAMQHGWPVRALLYDGEARLSRWAAETLGRVGAAPVAMAPELLAELGEKAEAPPELVAVVGMPDDDLARIPVGPDLLALVFDRPASPGNLGNLIRSADAFGAAGVIVTGHAADVYDPRTVRASTGSLFAVPTVRVPAPGAVLDWVATARAAGVGVRLVGTDERGDAELAGVDLTGPTLLLVGNETAGLSTGWREACDQLARIPITGSASSLNAATAAAIALYEAARQRASPLSPRRSRANQRGLEIKPR